MKAHRIGIPALLLIVAACNSGHGPDSLLNLQKQRREPISECTRCHTSANSPSLDPLVSNGSGTMGKHVKHFTERQIPCERCHDGYLDTSTHMNGVFDTGDPAVSLVTLSIVGPTGGWVNDTGPGTGSCAGVACHGNDTLDWYGTATWSAPGCATCHSSSFSSSLDPAATNGAPPAGRHVRHVSSRDIRCERCHSQYPVRITHANGRLDTPDPAVSLMQFDIVATMGAWTQDTGPQTGQCATISCHGVDTLAWYGTGSWTLPASCTTCHSQAYSSVLDPVLTNGTGGSGKHVRHVSSIGFSCAKCHENYPDRTTHASGVLDTQNPAVPLVFFDATNSSGAWTGDTGQETGSCAATNCHASQIPEWYGTAGVTPSPCVTCHVNAMGARRAVMGANGDFGANAAVKSHHVTAGAGTVDPVTDQCLVCHDQSSHMGGTVRLRNADTGASIAYTTASALEPFCLSCHDTSGATATYRSGGTPTAPFIDGSAIGQTPYRGSALITANWNKTYGHKQQGLTCIGDGSPNTGCHGNGHGTAYVGLLARNLTLPLNIYGPYQSGHASSYALCFDCHADYSGVSKEAIFGVRQSSNYDWNHWWYDGTKPDWRNYPYQPPYYISTITTSFRDRQSAWWGNYMNLHWMHVQNATSGGWRYRESVNSGIHCLSCHSVHGSNTQWGWVHDEMQFIHYSDANGEHGTMNINLNNLSIYPIGCLSNCHANGGPSDSWINPAAECLNKPCAQCNGAGCI